MRVLFLTARFPGPLHRGDQQRAYHLIKALSARHRITVLALESETPDPHNLAALQACCERVVVVRQSKAMMLARAAGAVASNTPLQVAMYDSYRLRKAVVQLCAAQGFDLAHVQLARMGPTVARLQECARLPVVVDLIDALSLNMQRRAAIDRGPNAWLARLESRRLKTYENLLVAQAQAAVIGTRHDRDAIQSERPIDLVGNGVDLDRFPFVEHSAARKEIVFSGNLGYFPNVDAATWFAETVFPNVRAVHPELQFQLVGARPARALKRLAREQPGVVLIGPVPEMHPALAAAAVAVAPLRAGSGQQLKILEAFASGTPVVASSTAMHGIEAKSGEHLLVADGEAATRNAVLTLLVNPKFTGRLVASARQLIEDRYTWDLAAAQLDAVWTRTHAQYQAPSQAHDPSPSQ